MTQPVLRRTVPRRSVFCSSTGVLLALSTIAAVNLYMFGSGRSHSTANAWPRSAAAAALRICVSAGAALRDLRFVSPSKFFVSTYATFSSSLVAQIKTSAGICSSLMIFTTSPTRTSSHADLRQCARFSVSLWWKSPPWCPASVSSSNSTSPWSWPTSGGGALALASAAIASGGAAPACISMSAAPLRPRVEPLDVLLRGTSPRTKVFFFGVDAFSLSKPPPTSMRTWLWLTRLSDW